MAIQFNDASQYINAPSNAILDINATDEIELNATLVDINTNVEISGTATTTGVHTFTAVPVFPDNTVETADVQDNAITLAKMAGGTDGNLITYDASGDPAYVATGSDGQVLTSTGAGSAPAFEALPAGGKILQVLSDNLTTVVTSSTSWGDIAGLSIAITPSANSSKILVMLEIGSLSHTATTAKDMGVRMMRDSTAIGIGTTGEGMTAATGNHSSEAGHWNAMSGSVIDSPNTTSEVTYKGQAWTNDGTWSINTRGDTTTGNITHSSITVMEIGV
jgi:hypothetical protein